MLVRNLIPQLYITFYYSCLSGPCRNDPALKYWARFSLVTNPRYEVAVGEIWKGKPSN